jgi:hypothetical protein
MYNNDQRLGPFTLVNHPYIIKNRKVSLLEQIIIVAQICRYGIMYVLCAGTVDVLL